MEIIMWKSLIGQQFNVSCSVLCYNFLLSTDLHPFVMYLRLCYTVRVHKLKDALFTHSSG